jgi:hypothetical protein
LVTLLLILAFSPVILLWLAGSIVWELTFDNDSEPNDQIRQPTTSQSLRRPVYQEMTKPRHD